jgi:hypothetical protein
MVFNATFNNISVLLAEETEENHWPVSSHWQAISHNVVSSTLRHEWDSNYHTITTTIPPPNNECIIFKYCPYLKHCKATFIGESISDSLLMSDTSSSSTPLLPSSSLSLLVVASGLNSSPTINLIIDDLYIFPLTFICDNIYYQVNIEIWI